MVRFFLIVVFYCLAGALGPAGRTEPVQPPAKRIGFPHFLVSPTRQSETVFITPKETAVRLWNEDAIRETRKQRQYLDRMRAAEEQRIRDRYRIETAAALQSAMAEAVARRSTSQLASSEPPQGSRQVAVRPPVAALEIREAPFPTLARRATETTKRLGWELDKVVKGLERAAAAIVETVKGPTRPPMRHNSRMVFFLLLLAIFLVPSFAAAMLLLAVVTFRKGHRLQASVFGSVGIATTLLLIAAIHQTGTKNLRQIAPAVDTRLDKE